MPDGLIYLSCVGYRKESGLLSGLGDWWGCADTAGTGRAIIRPGLNHAAAPLPYQTVGDRNKLGDRIDSLQQGVWGIG